MAAPGMIAWRKIRGVGEILLVGLGLLFFTWWPRRGIVRMARGMGTLAFHLARRDRRVCLANLDLAYGDELPAAAKEEVARRSFSSIALVILDLFWFAVSTRRRLQRYVVYDQSLADLLSKGPVIFVTGHLGNWEVLGQSAALRGYPLASVAKPLNNPAIDRLFMALRKRTGQIMLRREGALRGMLRVLHEGKMVGLLQDQDTRPQEGGVFVQFFGVPVPISQAAALLSTRLNIPVVMAFCRSDEQGQYRAYASEPLLAVPGETVAGFTQRITACVEREIRLQPGDWLWMYKRWKRKAPGVPREQYPFYADC